MPGKKAVNYRQLLRRAEAAPRLENTAAYATVLPSKLIAKLCRRNTNYPSKDLREMAWVLVADVEADFDQTALRFADELLSARDPFARNELERDIPVVCLKTREK